VQLALLEHKPFYVSIPLGRVVVLFIVSGCSLFFACVCFFKGAQEGFAVFSQKKKNQKEKSQPGSVAMEVWWLGRDCGCRNITNAAQKTIMFR
jgi:hypothetical protein